VPGQKRATTIVAWYPTSTSSAACFYSLITSINAIINCNSVSDLLVGVHPPLPVISQNLFDLLWKQAKERR